MSLEHSGLSFKTYLFVLMSLFVLTVLTVAVAQVDFGILNAVVAMFIACIKGSLVLMYFMNLKYEDRIYTMIFATAVFFVFLLYAFSKLDLITRILQNSVL